MPTDWDRPGLGLIILGGKVLAGKADVEQIFHSSLSPEMTLNASPMRSKSESTPENPQKNRDVRPQ
jgi:hypothetical protein